jgi:N-acetylmuramoyl-L-alanine amidase
MTPHISARAPLLLLSLLALAAPPAAAHGPAAPGLRAHVLPEAPLTAADRLGRAPVREGLWRTKLRAPDGAGSRVAALIEGAGDRPVAARARGRDGATLGRWVACEVTHIDAGQQVFVCGLGGRWPEAELELPGAAAAGAGTLWAELLEPRFPEAGRQARAAMAARGGAVAPPSLDPTLAGIGVIDRETWGARPTTCSSTEDDWYRMAIHHTAGTQTSGGTVTGAVVGLQAYSQDSGAYCDIPYQFLVGHDGSLYEGRPLDYTSGATGGGQNDGNAAVSYLGCYHPSGCPAGSHAATEDMFTAANLLVQTMVSLHGIPNDRDAIRGHQEWPGNSTACPGDYVMDRIDELNTPLDRWGAEVAGGSFDPTGSVPVEVTAGVESLHTLELRNLGTQPWTSNTRLAPLPRDVDSPLAHPSWISPHRVSSPLTDTPAGAVGQFSIALPALPEGEHSLSLALVEEWVTWFPDGPLGLGPAEGSLVLRVRAVPPPLEEPDTSAPTADSGGAVADEGEGADGAGAPTTDDGAAAGDDGGGAINAGGGQAAPGSPAKFADAGCSAPGRAAAGGAGWALAALGLIGAGRRRRPRG